MASPASRPVLEAARGPAAASRTKALTDPWLWAAGAGRLTFALLIVNRRQLAASHDPCNGAIYQQIMHIQTRLGRPDAARRTLALLETRLSLGLSPEPTTRQAARTPLNLRGQPGVHIAPADQAGVTSHPKNRLLIGSLFGDRHGQDHAWRYRGQAAPSVVADGDGDKVWPMFAMTTSGALDVNSYEPVRD